MIANVRFGAEAAGRQSSNVYQVKNELVQFRERYSQSWNNVNVCSAVIAQPSNDQN